LRTGDVVGKGDFEYRDRAFAKPITVPEGCFPVVPCYGQGWNLNLGHGKTHGATRGPKLTAQ
jgi:hypothetical protein